MNAAGEATGRDSGVDGSPRDDIIRALRNLRSRQAIVVIWEGEYRAGLYLCERDAESWKIAPRLAANLGRNGVGKTREGDQKSPAGIFSLATAFGNAPPEGLKYPYRLLTPEDYWVDDGRSRAYNRWVRFKEGWPRDWRSAESLWRETVCYQHAVIVNYNGSRQPEKGSAIFLHVRAGADKPTQGCTAVAAENMVAILRWLDFAKRPLLLQGSAADLAASAGDPPFALLPDGFAFVADLIPDICLALRDAAAGTESWPHDAILTEPACRALAEVQRILAAADCGLKIRAAYRPQETTGCRLSGRPSPAPASHSRGSAVDLTLVDLTTGRDLDLGETPGDCGGEESGHATAGAQPPTAAQRENRRSLRRAMEACGFQADAHSWEHFTLRNEPYGDRYFNFPARR